MPPLAYYRFSRERILKRDPQHTAYAGYQYIMRLGKYCHQDGDDGRIICGESANLPSWANSPADFWQNADKFIDEKSDVCYHDVICLPRGFQKLNI